MPRSLIYTQIYNRHGMQIRVPESLPFFIDKLERDHTPLNHGQAWDVQNLRAVLTHGYDFDALIARIPKRKNGTFRKFEYATIYTALNFMQKPGRVQINASPILRVYANDGHTGYLSLDWINEQGRRIIVREYDSQNRMPRTPKRNAGGSIKPYRNS